MVKNKKSLWLAVLWLWLIWASRSYHILELPIFVDESLHILRAQMVFDFNDATASILPGKLLLYYYLGFFDLQDVGGAWLARQAVVLLVPLTAALTVALTRHLTDRKSATDWVWRLYLVTPFLLFFERMALADTFTMLWGLALAIAVLRFVRRPSPRLAIITGLLLGLSVLAKLTALPWLALPLIGFWLWHKDKSWPKQQFILIYAIFGLCLILPLGYIVYQELGTVDEKQEVITTTLYVSEESSQIDQWINNLDQYQEATRLMFGLPLTFILLIAIYWQLRMNWRRAVYLLSISLLIWGFVILTSARPSTRYLVVGVPPLLILVAITLADWSAQRKQVKNYQFIYGLGVICVGVAIVQGMFFMFSAWYRPTNLVLTERDTWEYYQNAASGYALDEAAQDLPNLEPIQDGEIPVGGFVAACHTLRLYLPANSHVALSCPYFKWREEFTDDTLSEWETKIAENGAYYILADEAQPLDIFQLPFNFEKLEIYERPHAGTRTILYFVSVPENTSE